MIGFAGFGLFRLGHNYACGAEDGSRWTECSSQDQRMVANSTLTVPESRKWKSLTITFGVDCVS